MILITGATGHLGKATIDFLLSNYSKNKLAALVRSEEKAKIFKSKGIDLRIGDYTDYQSLVKAFDGVNKLLLISSSDMNNRASQHINAINAAKEAGVKHIVYTSFIRQKDDPNSALWFIAKDHIDTEAHLRESGINYTIFKNGFYMDMITDFIGENILETKTVLIPAEKGQVNFTLRVEIAEALANVLTSEGHENKEYNIGGSKTYSFGEIASILSETTGEQINYVSPPVEVYKQELAKHNVPDMYINMFSAFATAFAEDAMDVPSNYLKDLLGRKATSVEEYSKSKFNNN